jgi:hypothetical protein
MGCEFPCKFIPQSRVKELAGLGFQGWQTCPRPAKVQSFGSLASATAMATGHPLVSADEMQRAFNARSEVRHTTQQ